jgi:hypothetical protein
MRKQIIVALALAGSLAAKRHTADLDSQRYLDDVKFLASEKLRGRGTGTPELEKAAAYIAREFKKMGLKPIDGKSYFQSFQVTTNAKLGDSRFSGLKPGEDFIPFNFSSKGKLSGGVVFAGYGITAREYNYDDYTGIDAKGKIVLLLRHEPQEFDEKSVFAGKAFTEHSQFFSKASNARNHGATGVILINDRGNHKGDPDELEKFGRTVGPGDAGLPFVQVKAEVADRWFAPAGKSLDDIMASIDKDLKPQSFAMPETVTVDASIDVQRLIRTVNNVAGYLPGESDEHIIIGAHYDHLGLGEQFSMAPSMAGTPHLGADDNASGTAGVIELARYFAARPKQKRGILFLAFAGEEIGLLGSNYYVNHPRFPMQKAVAMINMDMIGRIRDGKVYIGGLGTGTNLKALVDKLLSQQSVLKVDSAETAAVYGSSDHFSFMSKQVPSLFFFSGLHTDYHKPSDTWDKISAPATTDLLRLIAQVGTALIDTADRPQFVRMKAPQDAHASAAAGQAGSSGSSGYGAYFGSIPDFAEIPTGVKFADVTDGSPASKAGLKPGDILVEFDGKPIKNLYDFTYALRNHKPGEEVIVQVLRASETIRVTVALGRRK